VRITGRRPAFDPTTHWAAEGASLGRIGPKSTLFAPESAIVVKGGLILRDRLNPVARF